MQKNMETKKEIRSCILKQRRAQSKETCEKSSMVIAEKLLALPEYRKAKNIYAYMDFSGEVKTEMILKESLRLGKNLWLPRVNGDIMVSSGSDRKMTSRSEHTESWSQKARVKPGKKKQEMASWLCRVLLLMQTETASASAVVTMINIWNYIRSFLLAAVAFGFQIVEGVPTEANDIRPQKLITEERIYE